MKKGFTIVEMILVIVIIILMSGAVFLSIREYVRGQALSGAATAIAAVLSDARTRTLSGKDGVQYGVHFEADKIVLFSGTSYSEGAAGNEVTVLDSQVVISDIALSGGGDDIIFEKLTGDVDAHGTITVELKTDSSRQSVITVQGIGLISYE